EESGRARSRPMPRLAPVTKAVLVATAGSYCREPQKADPSLRAESDRGRRARPRSERVGRNRPGDDLWIRENALSSSNARSSAPNVRHAVTDARSSISKSWL